MKLCKNRTGVQELHLFRLPIDELTNYMYRLMTTDSA